MKARLGQLYIQGDQKVLEESRLELAKEYKQMENESYEQYLQGKDFIFLLIFKISFSSEFRTNLILLLILAFVLSMAAKVFLSSLINVAFFMKLVKSVEKNGVVCKSSPWPIYRFS